MQLVKRFRQISCPNGYITNKEKAKVLLLCFHVPELKLAFVAPTAAPELCHRHVADHLSEPEAVAGPPERPLFTDFETPMNFPM